MGKMAELPKDKPEACSAIPFLGKMMKRHREKIIKIRSENSKSFFGYYAAARGLVI